MHAEFDYIVVGSGAGGGPLACNLALAPQGLRVALLEAGPDPADPPAAPHFHAYSVPAFHAYASEDPRFSLAFDPRRMPGARPVYYPRGWGLGGSTAVHALISMPALDADWEKLQQTTKDEGWSPQKMRQRWQRLEAWQDASSSRGKIDPATGHGLTGWLPTGEAEPSLLLQSGPVLPILFWAYLLGSVASEEPAQLKALLHGGAGRAEQSNALLQALTGLLSVSRGDRTLTERLRKQATTALAKVEGIKEKALPLEEVLPLLADAGDLRELFAAIQHRFDPNRELADKNRAGVFGVPLSVLGGNRRAVREHVLATQAMYPDRLVLLTGSLATRVVVEGGRAVGVEYIRHRYGSVEGKMPLPERLRLRARGEVILAGGAFNSPQLLLLSGIGPKAELKKHKIAQVFESPGVGENLHDRYEVSLVSELPEDIPLLKEGTFAPPAEGEQPDKLLREWENHQGAYTTNGIPLCILFRSSQAESEAPDLVLFGAAGYFAGYEKGYARKVQWEGGKRDCRRFTWAILKAQTRNRSGTVRLRSADPREKPDIQFNFFPPGDGAKKDLAALAEGMRLAEVIMKKSGKSARILVPSKGLGTDAELEKHIRNNAWGHHPCGSCRIGADGDKMAVLDGKFQVRGVKGLRVVDASVFPDIPGYFLSVPVCMASEKASEDILAARR